MARYADFMLIIGWNKSSNKPWNVQGIINYEMTIDWAHIIWERTQTRNIRMQRNSRSCFVKVESKSYVSIDFKAVKYHKEKPVWVQFTISHPIFLVDINRQNVRLINTMPSFCSHIRTKETIPAPKDRRDYFYYAR